ncbi:uncharacterized protein METZ01_LOCUS128719 [marine metagenome]|uniref:Uncharacterized protein n=1 Tax=marine metagenome TaxID=408172 RepID=A0A381YFT7_9ZZZZ
MSGSALNDFESHVSNERTHLSQVRRAFTKSLEIQNVDPGLVSFYVACSNYFDFSLKRLINQDYILHDLLLPHVEADNTEYKNKLESLSKGLGAMEKSMTQLNNAKDQLVKSGLYEIDLFKREAAHFLDVFINMLATNRHSTYDLEKQVFKPEDWKQIAGVTEESINSEKTLYNDVKLSAPQGCEPESFPPIGHHEKPK